MPELIHLRINKRPVASIAVENNGDRAVVAASVCHKKDRFDKRRARQMTFGRLLSKNRLELPWDELEKMKPGQVLVKAGVVKEINGHLSAINCDNAVRFENWVKIARSD